MSRGVVLLVEDQPLVMLTIQANLEDAGWTVVPASDGNEAIDFLNGSTTSLVALVTDIQLGYGGLNGWGLAEAARATRSELPVIYMTADSADMSGMAVSGSMVLQKPGVFRELLTAIDQLTA